jgi:hypothetical protein
MNTRREQSEAAFPASSWEENKFMRVFVESIPKLHHLPISLSRKNAVEIELEKEVLIFRASKFTQNRIENLINKQKEVGLTESEKSELQEYEEINDYLSYLNRLTRNLAESHNEDVS